MTAMRMKFDFHITRGHRSSKEMTMGPAPVVDVPDGTIPRISRLMALAIRFDQLIRQGDLTDQADLAILGQVSRARVTQIMNLLHLAPDIQEEILFLPRTVKGRDPIRESMIRPILQELDWDMQRAMWHTLQRTMPFRLRDPSFAVTSG